MALGRVEIRSRFLYAAPTTDDVAACHRAVGDVTLFAGYVLDDLIPNDCREKSLAITKLEEARMWANAAIARHQVGVSDEPCRPGEPSSRRMAEIVASLIKHHPPSEP